MTLSLTTTVTLHDAVEMPQFGLGVFKSEPGPEVESAVTEALELGYRHIDTAEIYKNEEGVGRAVAASGIDRGEIFITTKVWNSDQGYDSTLAAVDASLGRLGMEYVDLYLVHWPKPEHTHDTWRAMEQLQMDGKARAIGVSNFLVHHLDQLAERASVMPSINQIEFHPHLQSPELVAYCDAHGIIVEAWSPLKHGQIIDDLELKTIADAHGVSVAQVALRWMLQRGIVTIPKSVTPARIAQNADLYGFALSDGEVAAIDAMDRNERVGPNPDEIDF
ncbi:oxidoreductase of aldo/keto reductase family, subgroup 1 [hydrothermal vent metagenome]|uniref:Oxidoreductase of aldo/keto reductase family, subgroup 1 n=1 Tax=hydrothermal vent metagenome TaxID=652676 RepID=A0A3B0TE94_9ZZZZ